MAADWTTTQLGEVAKRLTAKNHQDISSVLTISAQKGLVEQQRYFNKRVASRDLSSYYVLRRGQFAYNKSYSEGYPAGAIKRLTTLDIGVVSPLYICFELSPAVDADFMAQLFDSGILAPALLAVAKEGARNHGLLNVALADFFGIDVTLPPLWEQKKIAAILTAVDEAIEATQAVIDQLQVVKSALMSELLTRGLPGRHAQFRKTLLGEIPSSWDVCAVGDVCKTASGGTPNRSEPRFWGGAIPWVKTGEIDYCTVMSTEEQITQDGLNNSSAKVFPPGTLLMAMYGQGVTRGKVALLGIEAATNQACLAFLANDKVQLPFLYYYFASIYGHLRNLGGETTQKNLSATIVASVSVPVPSIEEQVEIVGILDKLEMRCRAESACAEELRRCKSVLSYALLSGEVRVTEVGAAG